MYAGVNSFLFTDMRGLVPESSPVVGVISSLDGAWKGPLNLGKYQPGVIIGYDIGIVLYGYVDATSESTEARIVDSCGAPRWTVPGSFAWPIAITFGDDLLIRDKMPFGGGTYSYAFRRFSESGTLLADSGQLNDVVGTALVGADDTLYIVQCAATGQRTLLALDPSLSSLWSLPLDGCPVQMVLNGDGKLFYLWGNLAGDALLSALQTTSPGPAPTSWARQVGRDSRGTLWLSQQ
jgi:hypothetical protein